MAAKRALITGATGILGSYVLAQTLEAGYQPVVLMRDRSEALARERVRQVLALTGSRFQAGDVELLQADIREPFLALGPGRLDRFREGLDGVVHCAASVSFEPAERTLIWDTNVQGTLHVVELLARTGIPLYYVSTAYVSGAREGVVFEHELDTGQRFRNVYERTKVQCERLIQILFNAGVLTGAIFRPSIIVGALKDGHLTQFLNFYGFLRLIDALQCGQIRAEGRTRFLMDPACTKNLVPADWAAAALWHIIRKAGPSCQVYHLTHPSPPAQDEILAWANQRLHGVVEVTGACELEGSLTKLERLAFRQLGSYREYMLRECQFDRTHTDAVLGGALPLPRLGAAYLDMILDYARMRDWKKLFWAPAQGEMLARPAREEIFLNQEVLVS